jgi:predicted Fe-Mo cluster-binding NifX family protein
MVVCVPITPDTQVGNSWGRADRVAIAEVGHGAIERWEEFEVGWDASHDADGEGSHHARIARFLLDHGVGAVVAGHMGPPMQNMLTRMGLDVRLGASGDARAAVAGAAAAAPRQS